MSTLLSKNGLHVGRRFVLKECTRIGRASDNEVVLNDHLVSRYHAEINRHEQDYVLHDIGSLNGIKINSEIHSRLKLNRGDMIQIGKTEFIFEILQDIKVSRFSSTVLKLVVDSVQNQHIFDRQDLPSIPENDTMHLLDRLGRVMDASTQEIEVALGSILTEMISMFDASSGAIIQRNSIGEATSLVASSGEENLQICSEPLHLVLSEGKYLLTDSASRNNGQSSSSSGKVMIIPLLQQDQIFGAIYLERTKSRPFTNSDLALMSRICGLISGAVRHVIQNDQLALTYHQGPAGPIIGISEIMENLRQQVTMVANSDSTVLLTGETGTGKELIANTLHHSSPRSRNMLVIIDCSTIPANLMESELFGHEVGSFTGADKLKRGKFELADGGTVFLDELGELEIELQPKLLRFLEDKLFFRLGGVRPIHSDVRIIAATNRNLKTAVSEGRFRKELLFRLNVLDIELPPLRHRPEDVRPLVEFFTPNLASKVGKPFLGLVDSAWHVMEHYPWPGNIRELKHSLERALILSDDGILRPEHFQLTLPEPVVDQTTDGARTGTSEQTRPGWLTEEIKPPTLVQAETEAIKRALRYARGNRQKAAELLQIHRNTLSKKISTYNIKID
jgi:transcriptional regulator with GAF, ATPase, and Fis domain